MASSDYSGPSSPNGASSPILNTNSSLIQPTPTSRGGRCQRNNSNSSPGGYQTPPVPSSNFSTPSSSCRRRRRPHSMPATPSSSNGGDNDVAMDDEAMDSALVFVWGANISVQDVNAAILRFLRYFQDTQQSSADVAMEEGKYVRAVQRIMELDGGESLDVDAGDVFDYDPDLYGKMVRYPLEVLAIFDIVLMDLVARIDPLFEKHIQTHIKKMVSVKGMIIRCSSIIPEVKEAIFRCFICGCYSDPIMVD